MFFFNNFFIFREGRGNGPAGGGNRPPAYAGRFSYDQKNVHDQQQWENQSRNFRKWNDDG